MFALQAVKDGVDKFAISVMLTGPAGMKRQMEEEEKRYLDAAKLVDLK